MRRKCGNTVKGRYSLIRPERHERNVKTHTKCVNENEAWHDVVLEIGKLLVLSQ